MRRNHNLYLGLIAIFVMAMVVNACHETAKKTSAISIADSLVTAAYKSHDYGGLLMLADTLSESGGLSAIKANYWRGYAYSRLRKMRLAGTYWKRVMAEEPQNNEDRTYYFKSANRLAGVLLLQGENEATMKVALPALEEMEKLGVNVCDDYAYLLISVGCCQLRSGNGQEAAQTFDKAYKTYLQLIAGDNSMTNYTSAIVGVITVTDNYLAQKGYEEAYAWTQHFDELLARYEQLPKPDTTFVDKQRARLNFYRANALEGLGRQEEARMAYDEAMKTNYAQTGDGKLEATSYLMSASRWKEAASNYEMLDAQIEKYSMAYTMENITHFLLPKYKANIEAMRRDSALRVATQLCANLENAIDNAKRDETSELAIIYNTQQKETEIAQQKANLLWLRFVATFIALVLIVAFFGIIIYVRHQAAMRLKTAYHHLEIANGRAEESSRMKTNFIQQISHEIRTPLNILSGFTQIITTPGMELDDATRQDINNQIIENTNRITGLVGKMLELSDANSQTVIERNDLVLALQIAAQAIEQASAGRAGALPIDLDVAPEAEQAMLQTNEQSATRMLVLLLDNAMRFTKEGSIVLKLKADAGLLSFVVEDTGIGVSANEAEHIFEEFVQLDDYNEGTGIGLTVARSLARRLGGDVVLDTTYTAGARFVATLPLQGE